MVKYKLYWLDGKTEKIEGLTLADAFSKTGYGAGALLALDYWEEIKQSNNEKIINEIKKILHYIGNKTEVKFQTDNKVFSICKGYKTAWFEQTPFISIVEEFYDGMKVCHANMIYHGADIAFDDIIIALENYINRRRDEMTREEAQRKLIRETGLCLDDLPDGIPLEEFIDEDGEFNYGAISAW